MPGTGAHPSGAAAACVFTQLFARTVEDAVGIVRPQAKRQKVVEQLPAQRRFLLVDLGEQRPHRLPVHDRAAKRGVETRIVEEGVRTLQQRLLVRDVARLERGRDECPRSSAREGFRQRGAVGRAGATGDRTVL